MSKQQRYTPEFKAEAVKLVLEHGKSLSSAAQQLGIPEGTLAGWVSAAKSASPPAMVPGARSLTDLHAEVAKLRKELAEARMERDILKKATAYFARESLHGTHSSRKSDSTIR
jgi:transposase